MSSASHIVIADGDDDHIVVRKLLLTERTDWHIRRWNETHYELGIPCKSCLEDGIGEQCRPLSMRTRCNAKKCRPDGEVPCSRIDEEIFNRFKQARPAAGREAFDRVLKEIRDSDAQDVINVRRASTWCASLSPIRSAPSSPLAVKIPLSMQRSPTHSKSRSPYPTPITPTMDDCGPSGSLPRATTPVRTPDLPEHGPSPQRILLAFAEALDMLDVRDKTIENLNNELIEAKRPPDQELAQAKERLKELTRKIILEKTSLTTVHESLQAEKTELEQRLAALQKEKDDLETVNIGVFKRIRTLESVSDELQTILVEKAALHARCDSLQLDKDNLQLENHALQTKIKATHEVLDARNPLSERHQALQKVMDQPSTPLHAPASTSVLPSTIQLPQNSVMTIVCGLRTRVEQLETELSQTQAHLAAIETEYTDFQAVHMALVARFTKLEEEENARIKTKRATSYEGPFLPSYEVLSGRGANEESIRLHAKVSELEVARDAAEKRATTFERKLDASRRQKEEVLLHFQGVSVVEHFHASLLQKKLQEVLDDASSSSSTYTPSVDPELVNILGALKKMVQRHLERGPGSHTALMNALGGVKREREDEMSDGDECKKRKL